MNEMIGVFKYFIVCPAFRDDTVQTEVEPSQPVFTGRIGQQLFVKIHS